MLRTITYSTCFSPIFIYFHPLEKNVFYFYLLLPHSTSFYIVEPIITY